jgi:hypothetical protein
MLLRKGAITHYPVRLKRMLGSPASAVHTLVKPTSASLRNSIQRQLAVIFTTIGPLSLN